LLLCGCNNTAHKERQITVEAFSQLKTPAFVYSVSTIRSQLQLLAKSDEGSTLPDRQTRRYYQEGPHPLIWISRAGVDVQADSLLAWLHLLKEIGMSEEAFHVSEIEHDLHRLRTLDVGEGRNSISQLMARLEYQLTRACLRYCYGQRFGFINPNSVFNNLDIEKEDTARNYVRYRGLFDIKIDRPGKDYPQQIVRKVRHDSLATYLRAIQPHSLLYTKLKQMLAIALTADERQRIMVNMEQLRWRREQPIEDEEKRIVVNIPAYHLYAQGLDQQLDMRVVCGSSKTKTPLLSSYIEWMEVNPQWVIPASIIENEVVRHAGDSSYFARNRYHIYHKETKEEMMPAQVSQAMLLSGKYRVAQEGGAGNSLGRIVFRFKNNFSVFLHDTSNPGAFERISRAMSHGCVRVAKPFDLAQFVLDQPDDWLLDRLRISMGMPAETPQGLDYLQSHPDEKDRNKLIGYIPVKPRVPIYIIYHTIWPDENGVIQTWPDVYGYDLVVWNHLKPYL